MEQINSKKQLFDRWAPFYNWIFPQVIYQAVHKRLLEYVDLPPEPNVLDLGCGTGCLMERLAEQFPQLYGTGIDLSPEMLRVARQNKHHRPRLIYIQGQAESLPFACSQFDAVFSTFSFLHYSNPRQVLSEVARVLKSSGRFYLVDPISWRQTEDEWLPVSPGGIRFYSLKSRALLGSCVGLRCLEHHYLLGPVLLTIFAKPPLN